MITSLVESYVRAYAGKYLKNFSSDKLVIGFNTVKLSNLEVSTEHLWKFKMPFRPVRAFVGEISIDLSFMLGGKLEVNLKDVLFIFEKEQYDEVLNPQIILDSLQALISVVYFTMDYPFNTSLSGDQSTGGNSNIDLESLHRMLDRVAINVENLHFRVEEMYSGLASSSSGDMMCLGLQLGKLQLRSATSKEIAAESDRFLSPSKYPVVINKVIQLEEYLLYCKWDNPLLESELGEITTDLVRSTMLSAGSEGILMQPTGGRLTLAAAYQKGSLLLRPVRIQCDFEELSFHLTNEQILYLYHFIDFFREYPSRLQSLSRVVLLQPCPFGMDKSLWVPHSTSHRAKLRWAMIRRHVKSDWWRCTNFYKSGNMRWRTWFEIWVHAARYVALREILMYHVGYEAFFDEGTQMYNYAIRENLKAYYSTLGASAISMLQGPGGIDVVYLRLAEKYLMAQINASATNSPPILLDLEQDKEVIKALYAMQLDYDAFLPYRIAAFCRRRAEEKYVRRVWRHRASQPGTNNVAEKDASSPVLLTRVYPLVDRPMPTAAAAAEEVYVFFSVVDVCNLSPSFASSLVQCQVTSRLSWTGHNDDASSSSSSSSLDATKKTSKTVSNSRKLMTLGETKVLSNRISKMAYEAAAKNPTQNTPKTFVQSNHVFSIPLQDFVTAIQHHSLESDADAWLTSVLQDRHVVVEVIDRSMMTLSLGKVSLPLASLHPEVFSYLKQAAAMRKSADDRSSSNNNPVLLPASNIEGTNKCISTLNTNGGSDDVNGISVNIFSKLVSGNMDSLQTQLQQFQSEMNDKLRERKPILERALFIAGDDKATDQEEEEFILDPSLLTVQDVTILARLPQIKVQLSAVYAIPVEIRSTILADHGLDLPRTQHLPFLSLTVQNTRLEMHAANNPWTLSGDASFDALFLQDIRPSPKSTTTTSATTSATSATTQETLPRFALTLPRTTTHLELLQISTLSRYLDGRWDESCFEALLKFTIGGDPHHQSNPLPPWMEISIPRPVLNAAAFDTSSTVTPAVASASSSAKSQKVVDLLPKTLVWRSHRVLAHLFNPVSRWSKGVSPVYRNLFAQTTDVREEDVPTGDEHNRDTARSDKTHLSEDKVVKEPSAEYKMRYGDWYTLYPRHLNVVNRVYSWLTYTPKTPANNNNSSSSSSSKASSSVKESASAVSIAADDTLTLPTQKLHVSAVTSAQTMDCALILTPAPIFLPSSSPVPSPATSMPLKTVLVAEPVTPFTTSEVPAGLSSSSNSTHNSNKQQQQQQQQGGAWLGWWAGNNNAAQKPSSNKSTGPALPPALPVLTPDQKEMTGWDKAQLLAYIAHLQQENLQLKEQVIASSNRPHPPSAERTDSEKDANNPSNRQNNHHSHSTHSPTSNFSYSL